MIGGRNAVPIETRGLPGSVRDISVAAFVGKFSSDISDECIVRCDAFSASEPLLPFCIRNVDNPSSEFFLMECNNLRAFCREGRRRANPVCMRETPPPPRFPVSPWGGFFFSTRLFFQILSDGDFVAELEVKLYHIVGEIPMW